MVAFLLLLLALQGIYLAKLHRQGLDADLCSSLLQRELINLQTKQGARE